MSDPIWPYRKATPEQQAAYARIWVACEEPNRLPDDDMSVHIFGQCPVCNFKHSLRDLIRTMRAWVPEDLEQIYAEFRETHPDAPDDLP